MVMQLNVDVDAGSNYDANSEIAGDGDADVGAEC